MRTLGWLLVATLVGSPAAIAAQEASSWMERMIQAVQSLSYEGTFVYLHGNKLESMHITHSVQDGQEMERLLSLNGSPREVISDKKSVICILPEAKAVSISERSSTRNFPAVLPVDISSLSDYYDFYLRGDARIAGKQVKVVVIVPKDSYRYGYRFFLDQQHALPLKIEMLDGLGSAVAQTMFTSLRVDPSIQGAFEASSSLSSLKKDGYAWLHQEPAKSLQASDSAAWHFKQLPAGFELQARERRPSLAGGGGQMEHFVLSDGLATLSVYVERLDDDAGLLGESQMGATNAFGTQIAGFQVTAVGEVPPLTVQAIANALEHKENAISDMVQ